MRATAPLAVLGLLTGSAIAHADALTTGDGADDARRACERVTEPARRSSSNGLAGVGAGIVFDEHLLTDAARDQDYNGAGEITFSGRSGGPIGRALDRALGAFDDYPPKPCLLREDPPYSF